MKSRVYGLDLPTPAVTNHTTDILKKIDQCRKLQLDLGCGANKRPGSFGIDQRALDGVDLVWDLQQFPWPLPDNCAGFVLLSHFWEHIHPQKTLPFMAELHRVCEPGAQLLIAAPYGMGYRYVQDPTHCNPSNDATFLYWDTNHPLWDVYRPPCFHLDRFDIIPAGNSSDFNAYLRCCKPEVTACEVCGAGAPPAEPSLLAPTDPSAAVKTGRAAGATRARTSRRARS